MTALFVTATGTEVGKTFVTCGLIAAFRARGRSVTALKPVVSGFNPEEAAASDGGLMLAALGEAVTRQNIARVSPWRFKAPLSPDMAAARENRTIDKAALGTFTAGAITENKDVLLIEGVGGVMVPLTDEHTTLDWMTEAGLPLILIAGSYLGAISHALTAVDAVRRRGLRIAALVVNETAGSTVSLEETAATLARHSGLAAFTLARGAGTADFQRLADILNT